MDTGERVLLIIALAVMSFTFGTQAGCNAEKQQTIWFLETHQCEDKANDR